MSKEKGMPRNPKSGCIIANIVGIVCIIVATILLAMRLNNNQYYKETIATIIAIEGYTDVSFEDDGVAIDSEHDVYVEYVVDGQLYTDIYLNKYYPTMKEGDKIAVIYDARNPATLVMSSVTMYWICAGVYLLGIVVTIASVVDLVRHKRIERNGF